MFVATKEHDYLDGFTQLVVLHPNVTDTLKWDAVSTKTPIYLKSIYDPNQSFVWVNQPLPKLENLHIPNNMIIRAGGALAGIHGVFKRSWASLANIRDDTEEKFKLRKPGQLPAYIPPPAERRILFWPETDLYQRGRFYTVFIQAMDRDYREDIRERYTAPHPVNRSYIWKPYLKAALSAKVQWRGGMKNPPRPYAPADQQLLPVTAYVQKYW